MDRDGGKPRRNPVICAYGRWVFADGVKGAGFTGSGNATKRPVACDPADALCVPSRMRQSETATVRAALLLLYLSTLGW